ncbi:hypothetical protein U8V72_19965 [Priestia filamentosa]|uniref:hypothetical protein n=1 Tax=Priestia filamentosa TaxID=1402861 RepID=UPI003979F0B8
MITIHGYLISLFSGLIAIFLILGIGYIFDISWLKVGDGTSNLIILPLAWITAWTVRYYLKKKATQEEK